MNIRWHFTRGGADILNRGTLLPREASTHFQGRASSYALYNMKN